MTASASSAAKKDRSCTLEPSFLDSSSGDDSGEAILTFLADGSMSWIAERTKAFDSSGIRKVFDLARSLENPIDLSIGQPDFDVPEVVGAEMIAAIQSGKNGYALTQGMPVLREKLPDQVDTQFGHPDRQVFVSSGTSGGLVLTMLALVDPKEGVAAKDMVQAGLQ